MRGGCHDEHLVALDLTRITCALLVVLHHLALTAAIKPPEMFDAALNGISVYRGWTGLAWPGWIGVELFFVISGYVIATSAMDGSARDFLHRRLRRLFPAMLVCASVTALLLAAAGYQSVPSVVRSWSVSVSFLPVSGPIDLAHWTLPIEACFYMVIAGAIHVADDRGRALERVATALAIWSAVYGVVAITRNLSTEDIAIRASLLMHGGFFALGIMLRRVHDEGVTPSRLTILALALGGALAEIVHRSHDLATTIGVPGGDVAPIVLFLLGVATIAGAGRLQAAMAGGRRGRALRIAGLTTYPLYLLHQNVGIMVMAVLLHAGWGGMPALVTAIGVVVAAAVLIATLIEPRVRHLLTRPPRRRPAIATARGASYR